MTALKKVKSHPDAIDYVKEVPFMTRTLKNQKLNA